MRGRDRQRYYAVQGKLRQLADEAPSGEIASEHYDQYVEAEMEREFGLMVDDESFDALLDLFRFSR